MSKRITIVMNDKNIKETRKIQADLIRDTNESISFSYMVNILMEEALESREW